MLNLPVSLSSQWTTKLLTFRNPQGSEENWINNEQSIDNYTIYMGKVCVTEIGILFLCLTAAIETVAYGILFTAVLVPALGCFFFASSQSSVSIFVGKSMDYLHNSASSSGFTLYWNVANLTVFNIFCKNLFTNESFARYSMDHTERGGVFKAAIVILKLCLRTLALFDKFSSLRSSSLPSNFPGSCLRPIDILYIADWSIHHSTFVDHISIDQNQVGDNWQFSLLDSAVVHSNLSIQEGANFFKEFLFDPMNKETKIKISDCEPEIFHFVLTRAIYFYAFGSKCNEPIPTFFKATTRQSIAQLRKIKLGSGASKVVNIWTLETLLKNPGSFERGPLTEQIKTLFNPLKEAAYGELQHSLFLRKCWPKALSSCIRPPLKKISL